ncbi:hypothetical protein H8E50_03765 [bacterium]|nr:hypothetical protein [bacterium]
MKLLSFFLLFFIASAAAAADLKPAEACKWRSCFDKWTLASNQSSTGPSDTAVEVGQCNGNKTLEISTAGTVNLTADVREGINGVSVKTYIFSTSGSKRYVITHPVEELYVQSTITTGNITISLECGRDK